MLTSRVVRDTLAAASSPRTSSPERSSPPSSFLHSVPQDYNEAELSDTANLCDSK
jgi:hypothetical protein